MPRMWRLKPAFRIDLSRVDAQSIEGILRASPSPRYATLIKFSSQSSWSITPAPGHNSDSGSNSGERLARPMTAELRGKLSFRLPRRLCTRGGAPAPRSLHAARLSRKRDHDKNIQFIRSFHNSGIDATGEFNFHLTPRSCARPEQVFANRSSPPIRPSFRSTARVARNKS